MVNSSSTHTQHILIVDRLGIVGEELLDRLPKNVVVVFVTSKKFSARRTLNWTGHLTLIPFWKHIPKIPDKVYTQAFIIHNGEDELLEVLPQFVAKAEKEGGTCVLGIHKDYLWKIAVPDSSLYKGFRIVVFGDLFGSEVLLSSDSLINQYLSFAKQGRLLVPNSGMEHHYPVLLDDVVDILLAAAFAQRVRSSVMLAYPKHGYTALGIARILRKIEPLFTIDFVAVDVAKHPSIPNSGEHVVEEPYPLEQKLRLVIAALGLIRQAPVHLPDKKADLRQLARKKKSSPKKTVGWSIVLVLAMVFFPTILTIILSVSGWATLLSGKATLEKGKLSEARQSFQTADQFFRIAKIAAPFAFIDVDRVFAKVSIPPILQSVDLGTTLSSVGVSLVDAGEKGKMISSGKSTDPKSDFSDVVANVKSAALTVAAIQTDGMFARLDKKTAEKLQGIQSTLVPMVNTMGIWPTLFGFDGKKMYLVLFQNNMELRPGGGFIGSYGLLTLDNGKAESFVIRDVYDSDGQLRGHIEPPYPLRRYLPQVHWYLRDSNFSPDFSKSASAAAYMLSQETKENVDGVIGVDVGFVKNILQAIGPVSVTDYSETVTADNLYMVTQSHAEKNFFPGSTQKKDFLRSLAQNLQVRITEGNVSYPLLLEAIGKSIIEKHIQFAFADQEAQNLFTVNGLSGSLWEDRGGDVGKVIDIAGISEANVGVNKANFFINRTISQDVAIGESGNITGEFSVTYGNTSNGWPGGNYHNYVRFIFPEGASLTGVTIDDVTQTIVPAVVDPRKYEAKNFTSPIGLEVDTTQELGKTLFGFFVIVPEGKGMKIALSYRLREQFPLENPAPVYDLKIVKQAGTDTDPYSLRLTFPDTLKLLRYQDQDGKSQEVEKSGNQIFWQTKLEKDKNIQLYFSRPNIDAPASPQ